jgi:hypothetical protein
VDLEHRFHELINHPLPKPLKFFHRALGRGFSGVGMDEYPDWHEPQLLLEASCDSRLAPYQAYLPPMACVLPHGVLFRGAAEGHIRKYLIEDCNYLDAVIGLRCACRAAGSWYWGEVDLRLECPAWICLLGRVT